MYFYIYIITQSFQYQSTAFNSFPRSTHLYVVDPHSLLLYNDENAILASSILYHHISSFHSSHLLICHYDPSIWNNNDAPQNRDTYDRYATSVYRFRSYGPLIFLDLDCFVSSVLRATLTLTKQEQSSLRPLDRSSICVFQDRTASTSIKNLCSPRIDC